MSNRSGSSMSVNMSRRAALGLGAAATATAALGTSSPAAAAVANGEARIRSTYLAEKAKAGGTWHTHIAGVDASGQLTPIVEDDADHVTQGYSVQKLAVATAVMDKIDRGQLSLGQKLDLPADI